MKFTAEDEPDLTLPEDSIVRGRLEEIQYREFEWTDRKDGKKKTGHTLEWWWEITKAPQGAQYLGRRIKGECSPKITNRDGNKFREWAEALLGRDIPVGMSIDTDDLVGLEAELIIGHRVDRKDPSRIWDFVAEVAPVGGPNDIDGAPPF